MKLKYVFEGIEFIFELDNEDAKWEVVNRATKKLEMDINRLDVVDILDELDVWETIFDTNTINWLTNKYKDEARNKFEEEKNG